VEQLAPPELPLDALQPLLEAVGDFPDPFVGELDAGAGERVP
jgi:hypothetical protein